MAAAPPLGWSLTSIHPEVVLGVALLATLYAWAARRVPVRPVEAARFLGALAGLLVALNGPLHDLSDGYLFSAHMVQHLVLMLVVPPLLLTGLPAGMADGMLAPVLARPSTAALARGLTRPLPAIALYAIGLIAWHLPAPYHLALQVHGWPLLQPLSSASAVGRSERGRGPRTCKIFQTPGA